MHRRQREGNLGQEKQKTHRLINSSSYIYTAQLLCCFAIGLRPDPTRRPPDPLHLVMAIRPFNLSTRETRLPAAASPDLGSGVGLLRGPSSEDAGLCCWSSSFTWSTARPSCLRLGFMFGSFRVTIMVGRGPSLSGSTKPWGGTIYRLEGRRRRRQSGGDGRTDKEPKPD